MTTTPSLFQKYLQPYGAALLSSESMYHYLHCLYGLPRRVRGTTPVVEVFLDRSDPYSQLVAQVLPDLQKRFRIALKVWEVSNRNSEMFPEAEFWERHARRDAQALAELYQLESPSPDHMPELSTTLQEGENAGKNWVITCQPCSGLKESGSGGWIGWIILNSDC